MQSEEPIERLWNTRSDRPTGHHYKELYAYFGSAYYTGECLFRELCNLEISFQLPKQGTTRPRYEELLVWTTKQTMGKLAEVLAPRLSESINAKIANAVAKRNFLAHHFWFERSHLMTYIAGIAELISELEQIRINFELLDAELEVVRRQQMPSVPNFDQLYEEAMAELYEGKPLEPLPQRRKINKREKIVRVWQGITGDTKSPLLFETLDGQFMQLCDVGLCWSATMKIDHGWESFEDINRYLPADVNPRPTLNGSWDYELVLKNGAVLWTRLDPSLNLYRFGIRRNVETFGS